MAYRDSERYLTFVRIMSKYVVTPEVKRIIKTTKLYADNKTQVPREVVETLGLKMGVQIVWIKEHNRVYVESACLE